jgi:hypothetical protein
MYAGRASKEDNTIQVRPGQVSRARHERTGREKSKQSEAGR